MGVNTSLWLGTQIRQNCLSSSQPDIATDLAMQVGRTPSRDLCSHAAASRSEVH